MFVIPLIKVFMVVDNDLCLPSHFSFNYGNVERSIKVVSIFSIQRPFKNLDMHEEEKVNRLYKTIIYNFFKVFQFSGRNIKTLPSVIPAEYIYIPL